MLNKILDEIGDISGQIALDMGSGPCTMVVSLVNKIGDGRVFAVDLRMGLMDTLKKFLSEDLLLRTVVVKADLRRLDFLLSLLFIVALIFLKIGKNFFIKIQRLWID
jgi:predicted RNA methylase